MSDSYYSLYSPQDDYESLVPQIPEPRDAFPTYMPRAGLSFPSFNMMSQPPQQQVVQQVAPPPPVTPFPKESDESGGGMGDMLGGLGGLMGGMGGGDQRGFGSAPFISNQDSSGVVDSLGNIFEDGGDTSDWLDVAYTAAKLSGYAPFAQGGLVPLAGGGKVAMGPGGGLDDLIPTTIDGKRAAALSDGEFVVPADVVSMMGDGSSNAGAKRLYDIVKQIRQNKTGTTQQAGPLPVGEILKKVFS